MVIFFVERTIEKLSLAFIIMIRYFSMSIMNNLSKYFSFIWTMISLLTRFLNLGLDGMKPLEIYLQKTLNLQQKLIWGLNARIFITKFLKNILTGNKTIMKKNISAIHLTTHQRQKKGEGRWDKKYPWKYEHNLLLEKNQKSGLQLKSNLRKIKILLEMRSKWFFSLAHLSLFFLHARVSISA